MVHKVNERRKIMCPACGKPKMQFETERKAQDFIKWNASEFSNGEQMRVYYCDACGCFHISTKPYHSGYGSQLNNKIKSYEKQRGNSCVRLEKLIRGGVSETTIRFADEIYPQLSNGNFTYLPRCSVKTILHNFFRTHKEYPDSKELRNELIHMYNMNIRKKYGT